jgi:tryptophan halogenase
MNSNINKIIIVGGGSAGWMTASSLIKAFPEKDITVIASESIPTVGVGESTLSDINAWLLQLDISPSDFLAEVDGSYKLAIGFRDFYSENSGRIFYPFGLVNIKNSVFGMNDWHIRKALDSKIVPQDFVLTHYPVGFLLDQNKVLPKDNPDFEPFVKERDNAYQIDASKLGWYLREKYAIPRGVKYINEVVEKVEKNIDGISFLILKDGSKHSADLFIDCSGFKNLLLGKEMDGKFISTKDLLPNNKAWAAQVKYTDKKEELQVYTDCTAIENGWVWNIPLWSRIGTGYVYSDEFVDDDTALNQFKKHLDSKKMKVYNPNRSQETDFKKIEIKNGYYETTWIKNVVAIGLAAGFLEPLESTGLWFTHQHILNLVNVIKRGLVNQFDKDMYSAKANKDYQILFDFVAQHYAFSHRIDTEYWKKNNKKVFSKNMLINAANGISPDGFSGFFESYKAKQSYSGFGITSVAVGLNYNLYTDDDVVEKMFRDQNNYADELMNSFLNMDKRKSSWMALSKNLPNHYEYLRDTYYEI